MKFLLKYSGILFIGAAALLMGGCSVLTGESDKTKTNPSQGNYVIVVPHNNQEITLNSSFTFEWSTGAHITSDWVKIELYQNDEFVMELVDQLANTGSYTWSSVNSPNGSGENYSIKITDLLDSSLSDFSNTFILKSQFDGAYVITSPDANTVAKIDSSLLITWNSIGENGSTVSLKLYKDTVLVSTIVSSTSDNSTEGSYPWSRVTTSLGSGDDYKIQIESRSDPGINAFSDPFTILSQYNGTYSTNWPDEDTLNTSSNYIISWETTGSPGSSISLVLMDDTTVVQTIASSTSNTGTYNWYVSDGLETSDNYYIVLTSVQDQSITVETDRFTILSQYNGTFTTDWPSDDTLNTSEVYIISWEQTGTPGTSVSIVLMNDSTVVQNIVSSTSNTGTYNWNITAGLLTSDNYTIVISSVQDPDIFVESDKFTILGAGVDIYEPDSTQALANTISFGVPQDRSLHTGDVDWVSFNAEEGKVYIISTSGIRVIKQIYKANATSYLQSNNSTTPFIWTAPNTGIFYLRISAYSSIYGEYELTLTSLDSTQNIFINPGKDSVYESGTTLQIEWLVNTDLYGTTVGLYLENEGNEIITIATSTSNSGSRNWSIPLGFETSANYQIKLQNYSSSQIASLSETFQINGIPRDTFEVDDEIALAGDISTDGTVQQRTLTAQNPDWVKFSGRADTSYLISTSGGTSLRINVKNSSNTILDSESGVDPLLIFDASSTQTYYIEILQSSTIYYGEYNLSVNELDLNTALQNIVITAPDTNTTWAAGTSYEIKWVTDSLYLGTSVRISLYKDTVFVANIISSTSNTGTRSWSVPAGLITGGDYRVRVANSSYPQIFGHSGEFSISGVGPDPYEPDNTKDSAVAVATDGTTYNRSLSLSDTDWMRFTVADSKNYLASITGNISVNIYLYDATSSTQIKTEGGLNPQMIISGLEAGTYYLRVFGSNFGDYQITLEEFNPDSLVVFTSPTVNDTWIAGSNYNITWIPDTTLFPSTVYLFLYRSGVLFQSLGSASYLLGTKSFTPIAGTASGSTYQIRLQTSDGEMYANSANFTISGMAPDAHEPNDADSLATVITTDGVIQPHSLTYSDNDWFEFAGVANMVYEIKTTSVSPLYSRMILYEEGSTTALASSNTVSPHNENTITWFSPDNATYNLHMAPASTSSSSLYQGVYNISIQAHPSTSYQFAFTSPITTTVVNRNDQLLVAWNSQIDLGGNVDLFLYNTAGIVQTIQANTPNTGTYNWTVPAALAVGTDYYIRVISRISSEINGNSDVFTIQ